MDEKTPICLVVGVCFIFEAKGLQYYSVPSSTASRKEKVSELFLLRPSQSRGIYGNSSSVFPATAAKEKTPQKSDAPIAPAVKKDKTEDTKQSTQKNTLKNVSYAGDKDMEMKKKVKDAYSDAEQNSEKTNQGILFAAAKELAPTIVSTLVDALFPGELVESTYIAVSDSGTDCDDDNVSNFLQQKNIQTDTKTSITSGIDNLAASPSDSPEISTTEVVILSPKLINKSTFQQTTFSAPVLPPLPPASPRAEQVPPIVDDTSQIAPQEKVTPVYAYGGTNAFSLSSQRELQLKAIPQEIKRAEIKRNSLKEQIVLDSSKMMQQQESTRLGMENVALMSAVRLEQTLALRWQNKTNDALEKCKRIIQNLLQKEQALKQKKGESVLNLSNDTFAADKSSYNEVSSDNNKNKELHIDELPMMIYAKMRVEQWLLETKNETGNLESQKLTMNDISYSANEMFNLICKLNKALASDQISISLNNKNEKANQLIESIYDELEQQKEWGNTIEETSKYIQKEEAQLQCAKKREEHLIEEIKIFNEMIDRKRLEQESSKKEKTHKSEPIESLALSNDSEEKDDETVNQQQPNLLAQNLIEEGNGPLVNHDNNEQANCRTLLMRYLIGGGATGALGGSIYGIIKLIEVVRK